MQTKEEIQASQAPRVSVLSKLKDFREGTLILIILCIGAILSILSPVFFTPANLKAVAVGIAIDCIVVIGMSLVIISGGIDLSVGATMALSCALSAVLYTKGLPFILCLLCGFLASLLCGVFTGFMISKQKMPPFIVSMATMCIARGLCFIITQGYAISLTNKLPPAFKALGTGTIGGYFPILILISIVMVAIADTLFRRSPKLRLVFYAGSNEKTAMYSGIAVAKVKWLTYVFSAALCGIAGILFFARFSYASAVVGNGMEMTMIAGCVIGGISMEGGEGTVLGSVLGVIMLALITNGLVLLNISVYWQQFISGIILITAVWLDYYRNRIREQNMAKE